MGGGLDEASQKKDAILCYKVARCSVSESLDNNRDLAQPKESESCNAVFNSKAVNFCENILDHHRSQLVYDPDNLDMNALNFTVLKSMYMTSKAEQLFALQDQYRKAGRNCHVDIGYHYTQSSHLSRIYKNGLLTTAERRAAKIRSTSNGETFGDGVYTGNNPYAYHAFAGSDTCLLVARLKGQTATFGRHSAEHTAVLGRACQSDEVVVLRSSAQCLSMVHFPTSLLDLRADKDTGNRMVHQYHRSLQRIVDEHFNMGSQTEVPFLLPSHVRWRYKVPQTSQTTVLTYSAPECLNKKHECYEVHGKAEANCAVCFNALESKIVKIKVCGHCFHERCLKECLKMSGRCPICRALLGVIQGTSPSGEMESRVDQTVSCLGHGIGAIVILYTMKPGIQKEYHKNPGVPYQGTQRTAYIPLNEEGTDLLKRLKFAFSAGLTFTVGTSFTTGCENVTTWASIHHKTMLYCNAHGYPDNSYFLNVNEELDALHVPPARCL